MTKAQGSDEQDKSDMSPEEISFRQEAMKDAFSNTETPPETSAKDPEREPSESGEPGEPDPDPDPYEGMTDAAREKYKAMEAKVAGVSTESERLKQLERRLGSIDRKISEGAAQAQKDVEAAEKKKAEEPTPEEVAAAAKSDKAWKEMKEDFPEMAEAFEAKLANQEKILNDTITNLTKKVTSLEGQGGGSGEIKSLKGKIVELQVAFKHPDWAEVIQTNDWKAWVAVQDEDTRRKCSDSNDPKEVNEVLSSFKARDGAKSGSGEPKTAAQIAQEKANELKKLETPRTTKRVRADTNLDNMTDEQYREVAKREAYAGN